MESQNALFNGAPAMPKPRPRTVPERIASKDRQRDSVMAFFAETQKDRIKIAREIAQRLASVHPDRTVTVAEVRDEFVRRYGAEAWASENGTTHWTGGIFRRQPAWECIGTGRSPLNHSSDNRLWRLKEVQ